VGIDAEVDGPLPAGVARLVASEAEREHLTKLAESSPGVHWDRVLFSAKESVYKVWSPMTGEWLDFLAATIEIDPATATFTARVLVPGPIGELTGRYLVEDGLVLTAIVT
jgi:4'-phosphopantetheinyl transferase EntD